MAEKVITATANLVDMTPDMAYNKACSIIERGEWKQALKVRIRFQTLNVVGREPIHWALYEAESLFTTNLSSLNPQHLALDEAEPLFTTDL